MAKTPMSTDEARAVFLAGLDRRRRVGAMRIGVALVAWAVLYGLAAALWEPKAQAHIDAQVFGDLLLLFALAIGFTTPWTGPQREALWRRRERRIHVTEEGR